MCLASLADLAEEDGEDKSGQPVQPEVDGFSKLSGMLIGSLAAVAVIALMVSWFNLDKRLIRIMLGRKRCSFLLIGAVSAPLCPLM